MIKKKGLGRGLGAIFEDHKVYDKEPENAPSESILDIEISKIQTNPFQPRTHFDEDALQELAENIKEHGLLEPILIRRHDGYFQIVAGERRFRAHKILNVLTIKCRVYDQLSDRKMMEWALIENTQREQLSPIEEATAYGKLIEEFQYTHEKLASTMGKSRSSISNTLRLMNLPDKIKVWLHEGKLTTGHARALLSKEIKDPIAEAEKIIHLGTNVREAEQKTKKQNKPSTIKDPNLKHFEDELRYKLGTDTLITQAKNKQGTITIKFHNDSDLTRILETLLNN